MRILPHPALPHQTRYIGGYSGKEVRPAGSAASRPAPSLTPGLAFSSPPLSAKRPRASEGAGLETGSGTGPPSARPYAVSARPRKSPRTPCHVRCSAIRISGRGLDGHRRAPKRSFGRVGPGTRGPRARWRPTARQYLSGTVALACLVLCVVLPLLVFAGRLEAQVFKWLLIWVTLAYFAGAVIWISGREKRKSASAA
jgi:hypothetical protein